MFKSKRKTKAFYAALEKELRLLGARHIRYTKDGVPLPDWDKMIVEELKKAGEENLKFYAIKKIVSEGEKRFGCCLTDEFGHRWEICIINHKEKNYFTVIQDGETKQLCEI